MRRKLIVIVIITIITIFTGATIILLTHSKKDVEFRRLVGLWFENDIAVPPVYLDSVPRYFSYNYKIEFFSDFTLLFITLNHKDKDEIKRLYGKWDVLEDGRIKLEINTDSSNKYILIGELGKNGFFLSINFPKENMPVLFDKGGLIDISFFHRLSWRIDSFFLERYFGNNCISFSMKNSTYIPCL